MIRPTNVTPSDSPTLNDLAGIYLDVEGEEELNAQPAEYSVSPTRDEAGHQVQPTIDDLAGVYVVVEGVEELRQHGGYPVSLSGDEANRLAHPTAEDLAGIYIEVEGEEIAFGQQSNRHA